MNKKDLLYNNYKNEKIYKYEFDNNYYKSYGNISRDRISLGLSSSQLKDLRTVVSLLSDKQYKLLSDVITNAKNLGINITYSDILFLAKEILSSDKLGYNSSKPVAQTPQETEEEKKKREEKERLERERREKERLERERLERERRERERLEKEAFAKRVIDKFMSDITNKQINQNFRGWVLPNGLLISQYNETTEAYMSSSPRRQDHSSLIKTFMAGLEDFDKDAYERVQSLYSGYLNLYGLRSGDIDETFAVERLGWMQVSVCGTKVIAYRAERWQDRILRPFFMDYGFKYIVQDKGRSYEMEFAHLYDHMDEIMELGLRKRYQRVLK